MFDLDIRLYYRIVRYENFNKYVFPQSKPYTERHFMLTATEKVFLAEGRFEHLLYSITERLSNHVPLNMDTRY